MNNNNKPRFDTDAAWQRLDARIKAHTPATTGVFIAFRKYSVAAAIAVIAVAGWLIWQSSSQWKTITANAGNQSFQLPDGSSVLLRKGSTVRYKKTFNSDGRILHLAGEAFFRVQQNGQRPFRILTENTATDVLGTSFLVRSQPGKDEIIVETGKVSVATMRKDGRHLLLAAGQKLVVQQDQLLESPVSDVNYMAWSTGVLDFKDVLLEQVLEDVGSYYEKQVEVAVSTGISPGSIRLTARFQGQSLEQVLEEIKFITGLEMKKDGEKVVFYKK